MRGETGLLEGLAGDGRPLLMLTAVALLLSGGFAMFLAVRREFLPHDVAFLGMSADRLCALAACHVVRFMFHDRVAFGGHCSRSRRSTFGSPRFHSATASGGRGGPSR